jgi:proteic killer suppression protein
MIKSFKQKELKECWKNGRCEKIPSELKTRLLRKLDSLHIASCLDDIKVVPGNKLHPLQREYKGYWTIAVNGPWRLIFRVTELRDTLEITEVELVQYH